MEFLTILGQDVEVTVKPRGRAARAYVCGRSAWLTRNNNFRRAANRDSFQDAKMEPASSTLTTLAKPLIFSHGSLARQSSDPHIGSYMQSEEPVANSPRFRQISSILPLRRPSAGSCKLKEMILSGVNCSSAPR